METSTPTTLHSNSLDVQQHRNLAFKGQANEPLPVGSGRERGGGGEGEGRERERTNKWFIELGRLPMSNMEVGDGGRQTDRQTDRQRQRQFETENFYFTRIVV